MRIDLTCPVEVWHCRIPTEEYPVCTLQMYNLTDRQVQSLQVAIRSFDEDGGPLSRHVERVETPDAKGQHVFEVSIQDESAAQAPDLEILIEKVWFEDGVLWRRGESELSEYQAPEKLTGERLEIMQNLAGPDASVFPSDQGGVWVCVCSRANPAGKDHCARCGREKHEVFTKLNQAEVEKIILLRQNEIEEQERLKREQERLAQEAENEKKRKKKKKIKVLRTVIISLIVAGAAFYGIYFHGIPYYRYVRASQALENGQYASAKEQFLALEDYSNAAEMAVECDYQSAMSSLKNGTYTSLRVAQQGFDALGSYKDSALRAMEARYTQAEKYFSSGQWENAIRLYSEVPGYEDAALRIRQSYYAWGSELMKSGDYAAAREKFLAIAGYQDADTQAMECLYQPALAKLNAGDAEGAVESFSAILDYRDSGRKLQEAYYLLGSQYFDGGDFEKAADAFLAAGDYSDAQRRASQCLYDPAVQAMTSGDYLKAAGMFEKILGYSDAQAKWEECVMQLGRGEMDAGNYEAAAEWFNALVPGNSEAEKLLQESVYRRAVYAYDNGDHDTALTLFTEIKGYADADDYRYSLIYAQAQAYMAADDYEKAEPLFEELGTYENSETELETARLNQAILLIDQGEYEQAILLLSKLNAEEPDAQEHLNRARYLMALDFFNAGEYAKAADIFAVIWDYADAQEKYRESMYYLGTAALENGDTDAAIGYLKEIPDYLNASDLFYETVYGEATALEEAGDWRGAAEKYAMIPDYQDANEKKDACLDAYYAEAYDTAVQAYADKDYATAVKILKDMDLNLLPERYDQLEEIFQSSAYQLAEGLYKAKRPYEALPFYRMIPDYRDVSTKKLNRICYLLLGSWESSKADTIEELAEKCELDAEKLKAVIKRYNELCEKGEDEDFHKNPDFLIPIDENGPFYASMNYALFMTVMGGLRCNEFMQVEDENDEVIPGLFNVGAMIGDMYANTYNFAVPGNSYGINCLTFGYLLGRDLASGKFDS